MTTSAFLEVGILVPEVLGFLAEHIPRGVERILVAVTARKDDDAEAHGLLPQQVLVDLDPITLDDGVCQHLVGDLGGERSGLRRLARRRGRARSISPAARPTTFV